MTDYGNYQKNEVQQNQTQAHQALPIKEDASNTEWGKKYERLDPNSNNLISDKTREIFSQPKSTALLEKTLDKHDFETAKSSKDGHFPLEKTNIIAKQTHILPESNNHSKSNETTANGQIQTRPEVQEYLKEHDFLAKINAMTEDELLEALENPDLSPEEMDLLDKKLGELIAAQQSENDEIKQNISIIINDDPHKDEEQIILNAASKIAAYKDKAAEFENLFVLFRTNRGFEYEELNEENHHKGEIVQVENGTLKASPEFIKILNNERIGSTNTEGKFELKNLNLKTFTKEETEALQKFLAANYPAQQRKNAHEENHAPTADLLPQSKLKEEALDNKALPPKVNGQRLESASVGTISGKSTPEIYREKLNKLRKDILEFEDKIKTEVKKREILMRDKQRNAQAQEIVKTDYKLEDFAAENVEIENSYKDLLKEVRAEYEELKKIVNDPKKTFEIPVATSARIKSLDVNFNKVERLVPKKNSDNKKDFLFEVNTLKKEVLNISLDKINSSNIQVTTGSQKEAKTSQ